MLWMKKTAQWSISISFVIGPARPMVSILCSVLLSAFALFHPLQLAAQNQNEPQSQDVALLVDGPKAARGIPFVPPNVIQHYKGTYEYFDSKIIVYYTEKEIVRFSSWELLSCGSYRVYRINNKKTNAPADPMLPIYYYQSEDYSLFLQVSSDYMCTFLQRFMSKFIYFRSVQDLPTDRPPFPAVVD